ncbi:MAG: suppressor of fused domain protein [Phycisphaerae bacterium]|nr:suppressor of fused domain protein [Phycisphaerae bacterium]
MSDAVVDKPNMTGWDAIDGALAPIYEAQVPRHWSTVKKFRQGGDDPLDGISAYGVDSARPHWHYVSYGMSELYAKESDNKRRSGWGFEFTIRVTRSSEDDQPPVWPLKLLQNLARYVVRTGNVFQPGDHMDLNGPVAEGADTMLRAAMFTTDPKLSAIETPNGRVGFVQVVGVTLDELRAAKSWNITGFLDLFASCRDPLLRTDLRRRSILKHPPIAAELEVRSRAEGSATRFVYATGVRFKEAGWLRKSLTISLDANVVGDLVTLLSARLSYGRPLTVQGQSRAVTFESGPELRWKARGDDVTVTLPPRVVAEAVDSLTSRGGVYNFAAAPGLTIHVEPCQMRDLAGNDVQVLG